MNVLWAGWIRDLVTLGAVERLSMSQGADSGSLTVNMEKLSPGRTYALQVSMDLKRWSDVNPFTAAVYTNAWTLVLTNGSSAFYRLVGR